MRYTEYRQHRKHENTFCGFKASENWENFQHYYLYLLKTTMICHIWHKNVKSESQCDHLTHLQCLCTSKVEERRQNEAGAAASTETAWGWSAGSARLSQRGGRGGGARLCSGDFHFYEHFCEQRWLLPAGHWMFSFFGNTELPKPGC